MHASPERKLCIHSAWTASGVASQGMGAPSGTADVDLDQLWITHEKLNPRNDVRLSRNAEHLNSRQGPGNRCWLNPCQNLQRVDHTRSTFVFL